MQFSIGTCISTYQIKFLSVAFRKILIWGTVDTLAIQDEEVEMCARDEMTELKDIKFELSLDWALGKRNFQKELLTSKNTLSQSCNSRYKRRYLELMSTLLILLTCRFYHYINLYHTYL